MELVIFNAIHGLAFRSEFLDLIFIFFAKYSGYLLIVFLLFFLFKDFKKYKFLPVLALFSGFFSRYGVIELIRFFSYRPRPFLGDNILPLIGHTPTSSFPSGHTAFFFAFSTIIFLYNKKAGYVFFAVSFLIGFSRVVSGIHWPFDILGGIIVGIITGWALFCLFKKILNSFNLEIIKIFKKIRISSSKNNSNYQEYIDPEGKDFSDFEN